MHSTDRSLANLLIVAAIVLILTPAVALAKPQIEVTQMVTKKTTVVENGKELVKQVPADEAAPGETIHITLEVKNSGDETATDLILNNPIPEGARYVNGSAEGVGADITFSIDNGKSYKKPALLTYEITLSDGHKEKRVASPEEYTHLRWTLPLLTQGRTNKLKFSATIEK